MSPLQEAAVAEVVAHDPRALRSAFGQYATGVVVVTTIDRDGRPVGVTANSLTSVSLDPAMLLWCLDNSSSNREHFLSSGSFAVNVLPRTHDEISTRFASRRADRVDKFADVSWDFGQLGQPILEGALATFECSLARVVPAGDHQVFFGAVERFDEFGGSPLLFHRGRYVSVTPTIPT
jgi:flavin reductase (DIM6/NTAB) family NADH-FMN oxidoreductase RutF